MEKRPDQIASLDLITLIEEVKTADQLANQAKKDLEVAEEMYNSARSEYTAASQYQVIIRAFARALLSTRDLKVQERIRSKYQKKLERLYNFQDSADKTVSRKEVEHGIDNLMALVEKAAADIATKLKRNEINDVSKNVATAMAE